MPVVLMRTEINNGMCFIHRDLARKLPEIVGAALDVKPEDVIVQDKVWRRGISDEDNYNARGCEIYVLMHAFPDRVANLQERTDQIQKDVSKFIDGHKGRRLQDKIDGFVWVLPVPSAFAKI